MIDRSCPVSKLARHRATASAASEPPVEGGVQSLRDGRPAWRRGRRWRGHRRHSGPRPPPPPMRQNREEKRGREKREGREREREEEEGKDKGIFLIIMSRKRHVE
uniref:Uncharacterized protein n=1 Tax=Oryza sativa subsp. japonica TaxID=39947 RepID=Q6Z6F2_ORYSJ|nr:hypothetical protein [Oryza sativa Japonica Group]BAD17226.1 hypothetical protein [Oryza sativa Japonica Group]